MKQCYGPYTRLQYLLKKELLPVGYSNERKGKPLASEVLTAHLLTTRQWTSYFVPYRSIVNDQFGWSHFNWKVAGRNYNVLRIGCYPYIKYHCSPRQYQEGIVLEDKIFRWLKLVNLGVPTLAYGLGASLLIKHHKDIHLQGNRLVRIYFLYEEDIDSRH